LIGSGFLILTLLRPEKGIGQLPLQFLLKQQLHFPALRMAQFFTITGMAWYLKPLAGMLTDYLPVFGSRRYAYMLGAAAGIAAFWMLAGFGGHTPLWLLITICLLSTMVAICQSTVSALVVEGGRMFAATGRLSTVRRVAEHVAGVLVGPIGGMLALRWFGYCGAVCAAIALVLLFLVVRYPVVEDPAPPRKTWAELREGLVVLLRCRPMWGASLLFFLLSFSPGFQTPLFYYQTNALGFTPGFIGALTLLGALCSIVGAASYAWLCRKAGLRRLIAVSVVLDAAFHLMYVFYNSPLTAVVISSAAGLIRGFVWMPVLDLLVRSVPRGHEAVGAALEWTPANVAVAVSDLGGSWLYQQFGLSFRSLAWLNGSSTLLILLVLPFIPQSAMTLREGEEGNN
jgi:predicted MFS family arabinose efflux permease